MKRTCIIVSPYFPPSTLAGVHRARHLARHLPAAGWTPVVVCVDEAFHEERLDPDLAGLVPASVEVIKVAALPARLCRPLGFGEISVRAWRPLRKAVLSLLKTRPVGAVLITGSPYYPMLLAGEIKRRFGVPIVLDFQDPWVSTWGAAQPSWSKAGLSHQLAQRLEPTAVRAADFITSVSATQNGQMAARYPWLNTARMEAIPIGGDPEDYDALRALPLDDAGLGLGDGRFHLSYVGTIWPPVLETVRTLLRAARLLRQRSPETYGRLRLNFVGTTLNPAGSGGRWIHSMAAEEGVAEVIGEVPPRLPYLQALAIQANSDAILMLGSNEPHYTASKIYGALMSGRSYLSVFHEDSSAHDTLRRAGGGIAYGFKGSATLAALGVPLAEAIVKLASGAASIGQASKATFAAYEARAIAQQFANIFEELN